MQITSTQTMSAADMLELYDRLVDWFLHSLLVDLTRWLIDRFTGIDDDA